MSIVHDERLGLFRSADIYPVITTAFCAGRDPAAILKDLLEEGVKVVQLREKEMPDRDLFNLAIEFKRLCVQFSALLIIDDRLDIAMAARADGVHFGQTDLPLSAARAVAPDLLLGFSTHNPDEISEAEKSGASYINIGPVFPTQTKETHYPPVGLENLKAWTRSVKVPFSVMGGIKEDNIASVKKAGGRIFAMVTELTTAPDIAKKLRNLRKRIG